MSIKTPLLILLPLVFLARIASSQTVLRDADNPLDRKYTPPQGSAFNDLGVRRAEQANESSRNNELKFFPSALFRQRLQMGYQRHIGKGITAGAWLGKSFGRDYLQQVALMALDLKESNESLDGYSWIRQSEYTGSSLYVGGNLRAYFSGEAFDGGFVEFNYGNERSDYLVAESVNGYKISGSRSQELRMHMFNLSFGLTIPANVVTHELFFNIGAKFFNYFEFRRYQRNIGAGTSAGVEYYYLKTNVRSEVFTPSFGIGYAIGFSF